MDSAFSLAIHALVYLNHMDRVLTSEELAQNICTNPARVRKVMAVLKKTGLVETRAGQVGGYRFCTNADTLTLGRVAEAMDVRFVSAAWRSGDVDMECLVASGMADVMDSIYFQLDRRCRDSLNGVTIADIDRRIFGRGKEITIEKD